MGTSKILHKFTENIKGIGKFEYIIYFNKKNGLFHCNVPERKFKNTKDDQSIIDTDYLCNSNYKELLQEISNSRVRFESLSHEYTLVIRYKADENWNMGDGSGHGVLLNWGVFRKISDNGKFLYYLTYDEKKKMHQGYHDDKDWLEVPYNDKNMVFFEDVTAKLRKLEEALKSFTPAIVEEMANNNNLLKIT